MTNQPNQRKNTESTSAAIYARRRELKTNVATIHARSLAEIAAVVYGQRREQAGYGLAGADLIETGRLL